MALMFVQMAVYCIFQTKETQSQVLYPLDIFDLTIEEHGLPYAHHTGV